MRVELADLAKKNAGLPVKLDSQIHNTCFRHIIMTHSLHVAYLH